MPYEIKIAENPMAIPERRYASAHHIQFTGFNSCIGVLAINKITKHVIGVHLALYGTPPPGQNAGQAPKVSLSDVPNVITALHCKDYEKSSVIIVGDIDTWRQNMAPVYNRLLAFLDLKNSDSKQYDWGACTYGARYRNEPVDINGHIELSYNGTWVE